MGESIHSEIVNRKRGECLFWGNLKIKILGTILFLDEGTEFLEMYGRVKIQLRCIHYLYTEIRVDQRQG